STVDESMLTGESLPVEKGPGSSVVGGSVNRTGSIVFRATRVGADTVLARIIRLVEEAQGSKAPIQRIADRVAAVFVPIVLVIASVTFVVWLWLGPAPVLVRALTSAVGVLVIARAGARGSPPSDRHHARHGRGGRARRLDPERRRSRAAPQGRRRGLRQDGDADCGQAEGDRGGDRPGSGGG